MGSDLVTDIWGDRTDAYVPAAASTNKLGVTGYLGKPYSAHLN